MKRSIKFYSVFFAIFSFFAIQTFSESMKNQSSFVLIREMQHNLESGFYTLVLNQADQMDKNYPESRYTDRVFLYRAESYYFLGMRKLAFSSLASCPDSMNTNYLYGRLYLDSENFAQAKKYLEKSFKQSCNLKNEKEQYFSLQSQKLRNYSCWFLYASVLSSTKDYKTSSQVLLKLISEAGYLYEGGIATCLLCDNFYELGKQERVCEIYEKVLPKLDQIEDSYRRKILLTAAISYDSIHKNDEAKALFEKIMSESVASDENALNGESGQGMDSQGSATSLLSGEEIANFWIRMGIDSFNKKDFLDSEKCFKVARENLSSLSSAGAGNSSASLITLYEASILARTSRTQAISLLEKNLSSANEYKTDYESQLCILNYRENNLKNTIFYGEKVFNSEKSSEIKNLALFYYSKALEKSGQVEKSYQVLGKISSDEIWLTSAKAKLAKQGIKIADDSARDVSYAKIYEDNSDSIFAYENYIIEMIENSDSSFVQDKKLLTLKDGLFYQGLGYYLSSSWNNCISSMNEYKKVCDESQVPLAQYYIGFSNYQLLKNQEAYENFVLASEKLDENKFPTLKYKSNDFAVKCALALYASSRGTEQETVWKENAVFCLENAEKTNVPLEEKLETVLLLSKFYLLESSLPESVPNKDATNATSAQETSKETSTESYAKTENLLKKYASSSSSSSQAQLKCSMELASLYSKQKKLDLANEIYTSIYNSSNSEIAQEALYQNGFMYFENGNYQNAQTKFSQYRKDFISKKNSGKNYANVCYYNACCLKELGDSNLAILLLQESLNYQLEPATEFKAMYEFMKICRQTGDYEKSISIARKMMKKFPEQSKEEKISSQIKEITLLASGETEKTASLLAKYISNGQASNEKGRRVGVELAEKYLLQESKRDEGKKILDLIIKQEKNMDLSKEADVLAEAIFLKAKQMREENLCESAGKEFLNAAKVFARYSSEDAAKALYCAVESFDAAKLYADSLQTYKALKSQFSSSQWAEMALSIVSEYVEN